MMAQISPREALTIARIVRVNHAGEYGAIRIYSAQIAIATRLYPDIAPALAEMLEHEKRHCRLFFEAMPARHSRPCRIMSMWSWGGASSRRSWGGRRSGSAPQRLRPRFIGTSTTSFIS
jgi:3-demethoxyubiquinol 3-hydroxylase